MSDWDNFWNSVGDAVEDVVEWVEDAVEDVGNVVEDVVEAVGDVIEDVGDVIEDAAEAVVDWTLTVADTVIFDPVDFITGGVVDVDYDNGQFTADLNLGVGSVGISVGEQGFDAHAGFDIGIASGDISYDSDTGFAMDGSMGVDWGPLPYAEGHMNIGTDGSISIGGEIQATLPLPFGSSIGGEMSGELHTGADGTFGASSLVDVFATGPGNTGASFHNDSSFELGPDGFDASSNTDVLVDGPGASGASLHSGSSAHVGADGALVDTAFEADATGLRGEHVGADANAGFSALPDDDGSGMTTTVEAGGGLDVGDRSFEGSVAQSVSGLAGSGDLSDALSSGETDLSQVSELIEDDAFDDFTSDIVKVEIMESAADQVWDDVGNV